PKRNVVPLQCIDQSTSKDNHTSVVNGQQVFLVVLQPPPKSTLFPYTTLFRSLENEIQARIRDEGGYSQRLVRFTKRDIEQAEKRSEEHTSELQSRENLVCRLLLEKKKTKIRGTGNKSERQRC